MQVEHTTRRCDGFTGTGMSVRGRPTRYCSGPAPQLSDDRGGGAGVAGAVSCGRGGGGGVGAAGAGPLAGAVQAPSAISAAAAHSFTLPCAIRPFLPAANTTP